MANTHAGRMAIELLEARNAAGRRGFGRQVIVPIAMLIGLALLATMGLILIAAEEQNREAVAEGERRIAIALDTRRRWLASLVQDYAVWDEAHERLHRRPEPAWAEANIGRWLIQSHGIADSFVIAADGTLAFAMVAGRIANPATTPLGPDLRALLAGRGAVAMAGGALVGLVEFDGALAMAAVHAITRESRAAPPPEPAASRLVLLQRLEPRVVDELGTGIGLVRLTLARAARPGRPGVELVTVAGTAAALLTFEPVRPGDWFLGKTLPSMAAIALVVLGCSATTLRESRKAALAVATSEARAQHLALHDMLTGLPNRVLFGDRLERALARLRREGGALALLYLDLDRFKTVNDTLGHAAGDLLLRRATTRLLQCLRDSDTLARLGGDEFAILQEVGGDERIAPEGLARRLLAAFAEPFELDGHQLFVSLSIGIALAPADGDDPATLMKRADIALYRAKEDGRATLRCFEPAMDALLSARREIECDLRQAIERREFELVYQPQVDLASGRTIGAEALLRWNHPGRGIVLPEDFIAIAEETGLIVTIGRWVLRRACRDAVACADLKVSVNLSAAQFRRGDVVEEVKAALRDSGLPPARLELELTESLLFAAPDKALATLHQLRALGVRLAMDDFGTGYSSLSQLHRFPFDIVKIDRSFVGRIAPGSSGAAITRAIVELGRSLGLETVAEGVEIEAQRSYLAAIGCHAAQGFQTGRPMPLPELAARLDQEAMRAPAAAGG
jgi:diguanylate cyclase (GGDEF)-like protein